MTTYKINDLVVYGKTGVCRVTDITVPKHMRDAAGKLYYVLLPLQENCVIYAPVDTKMFMRPIISAEEANRLIDTIPAMQADAYFSNRMQELVSHYEEALRDQNCEDLIVLAMSIYAKKKTLEQQNHKVGQIDEKYLKQAEDLLCSEFSFVLGIPQKKVPEYIAARVDAANAKQVKQTPR